MKKDIEAVMTDSKNAFKIMLQGIAPSLLSLALAKVRLPNDLSSSSGLGMLCNTITPGISDIYGRRFFYTVVFRRDT